MTAVGSGGAAPVACSACGSDAMARVVFGEPRADDSLEADLRAGRAILGGCTVDDIDVVHYRCLTCGQGTGRDGPVGQGPFVVKLEPRVVDAEWIVARLMLTGSAASGKPGRRTVAARRWTLELALRALAEAHTSATFLVTPAGFLKGSIPAGTAMSRGWGTDPADFARLGPLAEGIVRELVDDKVRALAAGTVSYLVIGVDLYTRPGREPHGELAVVHDVRLGTTAAVTGKSFPTGRQERVLVRNVSVDSHLVPLGGHRAAVLVCHDLMAWGNRSTHNRRGRRAQVATDLVSAVADATVALHLPHTVSTSAWTNPWRRFREGHPGLQGWGSAILHRTTDDRAVGTPPTATLLRATGGRDHGSLAIIVGDG